MKKLLILAAIAAFGQTGAKAADVAPQTYTKAPVVMQASGWNGFYLGGNAGYSWMRSTDALSGVTPGAQQTFFDSGAVASRLPLNPKGFIGGGQIGYNWQAPGSILVYGIEADFSGATLRSTVAVPGPADPTRIVTGIEKLDWLATVRGRLGYTPISRSLVYITGGLAVGQGSLSTALTRTTGCAGNNCQQGSVSDTKSGWTAGGGLEYELSKSWSAKGEYLYFDLGNISHSMNDPRPLFAGTVFSATAQLKGSLVRAGVNYHF